MTMYHLYTDGSELMHLPCGGWGYILLASNYCQQDSGFQWRHGSNVMELFAVLKGLESLEQSSEVTVYTDSNYVISRQRNFHKQQPLVQHLHTLTKFHKVHFVKIKSGDSCLHNQAHNLAREALFNGVHFHRV